MTKKQHYMTEKERYKLEGYREAGKGVSWIARTMGFSRQAIYDELERGAYVHTCPYWDEVRYSADKAQQVHDRNQTAKGRPIKLGNDHEFANFLEKKMLGVQEDGSIDKRKRFSPAAALAEARREGYTLTICVSTLYSYIDKQVFLPALGTGIGLYTSERTGRFYGICNIFNPVMDTPPHIAAQGGRTLGGVCGAVLLFTIFALIEHITSLDLIAVIVILGCNGPNHNPGMVRGGKDFQNGFIAAGARRGFQTVLQTGSGINYKFQPIMAQGREYFCFCPVTAGTGPLDGTCFQAQSINTVCFLPVMGIRNNGKRLLLCFGALGASIFDRTAGGTGCVYAVSLNPIVGAIIRVDYV